MTGDQRKVAIGAISGAAAMAAFTWWGSHAVPGPVDPSLAGRLAYAATWTVFAALPLMAMVAAVGNERFKSEAIDPTRHKDSPALEINGRVVDNTMQQTLVFAIFNLGVAATSDAHGVRLCGAAALVFAVMRIAFWIGYRIHPVYRAFGFAGTFYLNIVLLGAVVLRLI